MSLAIVTSYFNPARYKVRRAHYERFREGVEKAGVPLYTIEQAYGDAPFELPTAPRLTQVRGGDVMWQKERLLNHLIKSLPAEHDMVGWFDADILLTPPNWPELVEQSLADNLVVQAFRTICFMPKPTPFYQEPPSLLPSTVRIFTDPRALAGYKPKRVGHTGFAWAARRELLDDIGLYDANVVGRADKLMAWTWLRRFDALTRDLPWTPAMWEHANQWVERSEKAVGKRVAAVHMTVAHLWHGKTSNRKYRERDNYLIDHDFDPAKDLRLGDDGLWYWASDKPAMHEAVRSYFDERKEDE